MEGKILIGSIIGTLLLILISAGIFRRIFTMNQVIENQEKQIKLLEQILEKVKKEA